MKVAVLKGGRSLERGVSLRSGARVEDALARLGHEVVADRRRRRPGRAADRASGPTSPSSPCTAPAARTAPSQELLEILGIPFTGPGVAACARCMDKVAGQARAARGRASRPRTGSPSTQTAFRELGAADALERDRGAARLPARRQAEPRRLLARASSSPPSRARGAGRRWSPPSATTTGCCSSASSTAASWRSACSATRRCRWSRRSRARATATTSRPATRSAAPTSSARPSSTPRSEAAVTEAALGAYEALGCSGFARVDLILGDDGPQVLEVNAIPGLTDTSLLPQAAEAAGHRLRAAGRADPRRWRSTARRRGPRPLVVALGEVVGGDLVEELFEFVMAPR